MSWLNQTRWVRKHMEISLKKLAICCFYTALPFVDTRAAESVPSHLLRRVSPHQGYLYVGATQNDGEADSAYEINYVGRFKTEGDCHRGLPPGPKPRLAQVDIGVRGYGDLLRKGDPVTTYSASVTVCDGHVVIEKTQDERSAKKLTRPRYTTIELSHTVDQSVRHSINDSAGTQLSVRHTIATNLGFYNVDVSTRRPSSSIDSTVKQWSYEIGIGRTFAFNKLVVAGDLISRHTNGSGATALVSGIVAYRLGPIRLLGILRTELKSAGDGTYLEAGIQFPLYPIK
jgi:hypothetical protein